MPRATQQSSLAHVRTLSRRVRERISRALDAATRRNLEITETLRGDPAPRCCRCSTLQARRPAAVCLRHWLTHPLRAQERPRRGTPRRVLERRARRAASANAGARAASRTSSASPRGIALASGAASRLSPGCAIRWCARPALPRRAREHRGAARRLLAQSLVVDRSGPISWRKPSRPSPRRKFATAA
jgi:hypothetical protein